ncbi:MAG: arsenic efflux protein [Candidatus Marinimicrobia bacterium]|nr:arsenic efflux protein [Candidatus Neomarinimicrobiota bacterium]
MIILNAFKHSLMITGFIFVMMLVIEYINVQTRGVWHDVMKRGKWMQYVVAALLGAIPGCLGAFTAVTLFSHGMMSLGALVATMIATSGDEAFVMLAMFPGKALLLIALTFLIGIVSGFLTDKFIKLPGKPDWLREKDFPLHEEDNCICFPRGEIKRQLQQSSMERVLLVGIILMLSAVIFTGKIGPAEWNWVRITLLISMLVSLFIVSTVPEHFLKEHLWNHIVKVHIPKIFLWTFGTLLVIGVLMQYIDITTWIAGNLVITLLIAVLIGIIPESGPHLVFVTLFFNGTLPFGILLANSIVQDGHGMIPLLAESKRSFLLVKSINVIVGLMVGLLFIGIGL